MPWRASPSIPSSHSPRYELTTLRPSPTSSYTPYYTPYPNKPFAFTTSSGSHTWKYRHVPEGQPTPREWMDRWPAGRSVSDDNNDVEGCYTGDNEILRELYPCDDKVLKEVESGKDEAERYLNEREWQQVTLGDLWDMVKLVTMKVAGNVKGMLGRLPEALSGRGVWNVWGLYLVLAFAGGVFCGRKWEQRNERARTTAATAREMTEDDDDDDSDFSPSESSSSSTSSSASSTTSRSNSTSSVDHLANTNARVLPQQEQGALETAGSSSSTRDAVFPIKNQPVSFTSAQDITQSAQQARMRRGGRKMRKRDVAGAGQAAPTTARTPTRQSARIQEAASSQLLGEVTRASTFP